MTESLVGFGVMLLLAFARVPIAFAMAFVGFAGFAMLTSLDAGLAMVGQVTYENGITYELVVLPLFILMGNLVTRSGFSEALYRAAYAFLGHLRGGLAMATVVACGGFSAVCGSSLATAATMVKVAMPSMRHYRYADGLAAGSIAAGGTLGILIPPSVILVIYGVITETNIGKLFIAGILPGFVAVVFFIFAIGMVTSLHPEVGPSGERSGWRERMLAMADVWGVVLLFLLVMGGIYGGAFTATEAAGIGAGGALVLALLRGSLGLCGLYDVLRESLITTSWCSGR
jgi:tripartite ATP-independent transporter DctM subunit